MQGVFAFISRLGQNVSEKAMTVATGDLIASWALFDFRFIDRIALNPENR
jgi:hypothetical protein